MERHRLVLESNRYAKELLTTRWNLARTTLSVVAAFLVILSGYYVTVRRQADLHSTAQGVLASSGQVLSLVRLSNRTGISSSSSTNNGRNSLTTNVDGNSATSSASTEAGVAIPSPSLHTVRRPKVTIVCVSDTHGLFEEEGLIKVPEGDMLLFPGDVAVGTAAEGLAFSAWLEKLPVPGPKVLTWGNMDTATPGLVDPVPAATVLVNTIQEINGYRIFGSPFTPRFAGAYQLDLNEDESYAYWTKLLPPNSDVDIILTHGPPYGFADKTGGRHRGDMGLLRAVQALQRPPLLWVCGHIHEQYGEHQVPHARAPGGHIRLLNSAVYYVQQPAHAQSAQPRAVRMPEAEVLPR